MMQRRPEEPSQTLGPHRGRSWLIVLAVTLAAGAMGYLASWILGCSTTCATGRSPFTFGLLTGVTAGLASLSGCASLSRGARRDKAPDQL